MAKTETETKQGQLPPFATDKGDWFYEIAWEPHGLCYLTKYVPNTRRLVEIAEHFGCGFVYAYEEPHCFIYGKATYHHGVFTDAQICDGDTRSIRRDKKTQTYRFEGASYNSFEDILEIIVNRKLKAKQP